MGRKLPLLIVGSMALFAVFAIIFATVLLPRSSSIGPSSIGSLIAGNEEQERTRLAQRLQQGHEYQKDGEYDKAIAAFDDVATAKPELADVKEAELQLGQTYALNRDYVNGAAALQQFYDGYPEDPRHDQVGFLLGVAYRELKQWDRATTLLSDYAEKDPGIEQYVRYQLAVAYRDAGDLPRAIEEFGKAVTGTGPRLFEVDAMDQIAAACVKINDYESALTWYDKIRPRAALDGYKSELNYRSGLAQKALGRTAEAKALFLNNVINFSSTYYASLSLDELDRMDATAVSPYLAGLVNYLNGRFDRALTDFGQVPGNSQSAADALYYQGMIYQKQGKQTQAITKFDRVIKDYPNSTRVGAAWFQKGESQWSTENYSDAVATFRQFASALPRHDLAQDARWEAAQLLESVQQLDEARKEYATLQQSYPSGRHADDATFRQGLIYFKSGQFDKAIQTWDANLRAFASGTQKAKASYWAGKAAQLAGRTADADNYLLQSIQTTPDEYWGFRARAITRTVTETLAIDGIRQSLSEPDSDQERKDAVDWLGKWVSPAPNISAISVISDTIREDPAFKKGEDLLKIGLKEDAAREYQDVADRFRSDAVSGLQLALYFREKGLYQLSINTATKLATLSGEKNYFNLPRLLLKLLYPPYYHGLAIDEAEKGGLDPFLLLALIRQESLFDKDAASVADARGLTQVIPATGQWLAQKLKVVSFSPDDLFKPYVSIRFGAAYLGGLIDEYDGNPFFALAGYNGGPGNVSRWSNSEPTYDTDLFVENIDYSETQRYVKLVSETYGMYKYIYGIPADSNSSR